MMYQTEDEYWDWLENEAAPAERYLSDRVRDFEDLFEDMVFAEGSITNVCSDDGTPDAAPDGTPDAAPDGAPDGAPDAAPDAAPEEGIEHISMDVSDAFTNFSYCSLHYKVEKSDTDDGSYNAETHTLCVSPDQLREDHTILHEMLHAYCRLQDEADPVTHGMACWALYKDLRKKIPGLDSIIDDVIEIRMRNYEDRGKGRHDILFLLKSLDLDIRMGYPLGRVFAYGLEDRLKEMGLVPEK